MHIKFILLSLSCTKPIIYFVAICNQLPINTKCFCVLNLFLLLSWSGTLSIFEFQNILITFSVLHLWHLLLYIYFVFIHFWIFLIHFIRNLYTHNFLLTVYDLLLTLHMSLQLTHVIFMFAHKSCNCRQLCLSCLGLIM